MTLLSGSKRSASMNITLASSYLCNVIHWICKQCSYVLSTEVSVRARWKWCLIRIIPLLIPAEHGSDFREVYNVGRGGREARGRFELQ